jgi:hypothetical protein
MLVWILRRSPTRADVRADDHVLADVAVHANAEHAEVRIDAVAAAPEDAAELIIAHLRGTGILDPP